MARIAPEQISVVIQGPIYRNPDYTRLGIESVRRKLPGAEIILSTWQDADVSGLDYDRLVRHQDPGNFAILNEGVTTPININRQIVNTLGGLKQATRPYSIKLRSDHQIAHLGFLDYFERYPKRARELSVLKERVVVCDLFTHNPRTFEPFPFSPSDWFYFGRTEDLIDIWDIPFAPAQLFTAGFNAELPRPPGLIGFETARYTVEQYLWLEFLKKHVPIDLRHYADDRPEMLRLSDLSFANNLIILDLEKIGLVAPKYALNFFDYTAGLFTHKEWELLYRDHCDPEFHVPGEAAHRMKVSLLRGISHQVRILRILVKRRFPGLGRPYKQLKGKLLRLRQSTKLID